MKAKIITFLIIMCLFVIGTNAYAGGNLIVDGNAGIGTDTPNARLDVRGDAVFNEDGGDYDFRVEGDTDPTLFTLDAGIDAIGIGGNAISGQRATLYPLNASSKGLIVKGLASQSGNLLEIQDNSGNVNALFDAGGRLAIGTTPFWGTVPLTLKGTGTGAVLRIDAYADKTTVSNEYGILSTFYLKGSGSQSSGKPQKVGNAFTLQINNAANYNWQTGRWMAASVSIDGRPGNPTYVRDLSGLEVNHYWENSVSPYFSAENYGGIIVRDIAKYGTYGLDTITNAFGIMIEKQTYGTNKMGIWLNGDREGADIVFGPNKEARIYLKNGVLYATDNDFNQTQISPHDPETGEWIFYSKNLKTGKVIRVNMEKLIRAVEKLTGEKFMIETYEE